MSLLRLGIRRAALPLSGSGSGSGSWSGSVLICRRCVQLEAVKFRFPYQGQGPATIPRDTAMASLGNKLTQDRKLRRLGPEKAKTWWPESNSKTVGYWLLGSAASVFGIVVFGGLTRLTESGLSITEWRPVTGTLPPLSPDDWQSEFDKYRASPEFAILNPHMDLDDFKKIYWMEWAHRLWGRVIGVTFALPAVYFVARRRVTPRMAGLLAGLTGLIGAQGALGWWMVKSGLHDDLFAPGSHPRVSQYRLAAHLGTAFACYSGMLLAGLSVLRENYLLDLGYMARSGKARRQLHAWRKSHERLRVLRRAVTALTGLIFITVLSGALVAGLDAGLIYNEYPRMGTGFTPPSSELWNRFYCRRADGADLWWRNMLENPALVQLEHRILTASTVCAVLGLWAFSRRMALPEKVRTAVVGLVRLVTLQFGLGFFTLIYMTPMALASAHQAGALALLTGVLVLGHRLRVPKSTLMLLQTRLARAGVLPAKSARSLEGKW